MERVYVVGASMTPSGKCLDKSVRDSTRKAGTDALRDANCEAGMVDPSNCDEKLHECRVFQLSARPKPPPPGV